MNTQNKYQTMFINHLNNNKLIIITSIISSILRSGLMILPIYITRNIVNYLTENKNIDINNVSIQSIFLIACPTLVLILYIIDTKFSKYIFILIKDIRTKAIEESFNEDISIIKNYDTSNMYDYIINSTRKIEAHYFSTISNLIWYISTIFIGFILMIIINIYITVILIIITLLQILFINYLKKYISQNNKYIINNRSESLSIINNLVTHYDYIYRNDLSLLEFNNYKNWEFDTKKLLDRQNRITTIGIAINSFSDCSRLFFIIYISSLLITNDLVNIGDIIGINNLMIWVTPVIFYLQNWIIENQKNISEKEKVITQINKINQDKPEVYINEDIYKMNIKNLRFKGLLIEDEINLYKGNVVYIKGDSGIGKTTFIEILSNYEKNYTGSITVNDVNYNEYNILNLSNKIILLSQKDYIVNSDLHTNIIFYREYISEERFNEIITTFNIRHLLNIDSKDWSDGEKRRVSIARAIIEVPDVLLLDEPLSGVDHITGNVIMNYLIKEMENGILIVVTHDKISEDTIIDLNNYRE